MRHQPLTDVARAVDDVDNAVGQPGIRHDLHEVGHRDRRPLGWLDHDRVADGDTRRDELDRDEGREVPRGDRGVDAVRLAEREDPLRRVLRRDDRRLHPLHVFRRDAEVLRGLVDVAESLARIRLALLERQLARELLAPLIDQVRDRVTDAPAIPGRERSPFRLSLARRGNRPIDVFCARIRRLRERLTRYRRDDLPGAVAGRGDPLAADEVVQGADGDRHAGIFLHRRPTSRLKLPTRGTGFETSAGAAAVTPSEPEDEYGFAGEAVGEWSRVWRRFIRRRLAFASLILLVVVSAAGLLAAHIAPYGYLEVNPTALSSGPTWAHPFGTDQIGRDYFSRVVYGIGTEVEIVLLVAFFGTAIGTLVGPFCGYFGGGVDNVLMRFKDLLRTTKVSASPQVLIEDAQIYGFGDEIGYGGYT